MCGGRREDKCGCRWAEGAHVSMTGIECDWVRQTCLANVLCLGHFLADDSLFVPAWGGGKYDQRAARMAHLGPARGMAVCTSASEARLAWNLHGPFAWIYSSGHDMQEVGGMAVPICGSVARPHGCMTHFAWSGLLPCPARRMHACNAYHRALSATHLASLPGRHLKTV